MHDSFLLYKIARTLQQICDENRLRNIKEAVIEVSYNSHIDSEDLHQHLVEIIPKLVDNCTIITVNKKDIEDQTALIYLLKGDSLDAEA